MFVVRGVLFGCSLACVVCCLLFVGACRSLQLAVCCSSCAVCCFLFGVWCLLFGACWLLRVALVCDDLRCSLFAVAG